jgi:hypothetical protein
MDRQETKTSVQNDGSDLGPAADPIVGYAVDGSAVPLSNVTPNLQVVSSSKIHREMSHPCTV